MSNPRKVGLKIEIDGEAEYKKAIQNINRDNQLLNAEMKALTEEYKNNADSMDFLTQKGEKLESMLLEAQAKVSLLKDALRKASEEYGAADDRTTEWAIKLASAEEAQHKVENAILENNEAIRKQVDSMEESEEAVEGLGDQLDDLAGILGINIPDAARDALNEIDGFSGGAVAEFAGVAGGAAAAYKVVKALYDMTVQAAAKADELLTRSAQTGLSTDLLQQLDYAQKFLDFDGIDKSLQSLTKSMGKASEGAQAQSEAFKALGVEIYDEDGMLRNNYDVMLDVIDALGSMEDETQRDIVANQLFGRSYTELKPLIQAGSEELKKYTDRAQEMGYVIDEKTIKALGRLDDALQENRTATETAATEAAGFFAPIFQSIVDLGTGATNVVRGLFSSDVFQGIEAAINPAYAFVDVWHSIAEAVYDAKDAQDAAAGSAETDAFRMSEATGIMQEAVAALGEAYQEAYEEAKQALDGQFGLFEDASERLATSTEKTQQKLQEFWEKAYEAAEKSLDGQFGLFDEASTEFETSADDMIAALDSQLSYWNEYENNLNTVLNKGIEGVREFAAAHSDGSSESVQAIAALAAADDEKVAEIIDDWQQLQDAQSSVAGSYATLATEGAAAMGELADETKISVDDMIAALDSQKEYWDSYEADLNALLSRNIEGIESLAARFSDGSEESKDALAALATATDEEIAEIISKMGEVDEKREGLAEQVAGLQTDVETKLAEIRKAYEESVQEVNQTVEKVDLSPFDKAVEESFGFLDTTSGASIEKLNETLASVDYEPFETKADEATAHMDEAFGHLDEASGASIEKLNETLASVDYGPFEASADAAFGYLEGRAGDAVSNVRGMLAELSAEIDAVEARAQSVGHNAGGTDNWRGGASWVAENGPELVELPRGSKVHTAQETRQIMGAGADTRKMEALMEQNVRLLEQISSEFSGLRVKGRMA